MESGLWCILWSSFHLVVNASSNESMALPLSPFQVPYSDLTPLQAAVGVVQKVRSFKLDLEYPAVSSSIAQYLFSQCSCLFQEYTCQVLPFCFDMSVLDLAGITTNYSKKYQSKTSWTFAKVLEKWSIRTAWILRNNHDAATDSERGMLRNWNWWAHSSLPIGGTLALYNLW